KTINDRDVSEQGAEGKRGFELLRNNITLNDGSEKTDQGKVTKVKGNESRFVDYALEDGAHISRKNIKKETAYEIYQINEDKSRSFLGVSNVENFYANALTRVGETNNTTFEIVPVDRYGTQGTSAKADMDWPDNSKPKAGATASRTLLNVGDEVTFTSASSKNTAEVAWFLPGSSKE
ncbi:GH85 family endohexosaminidase C-terminal domain-containing protein, partial [Bifidobacterium animalis]|uniref:GH85 family endohexosaminidase C-terminal domain-containing protein n=1 Tax=Bifidobacterium animalis TaxID=28025 RepID=UPI003FEE07E6